MRKRYRVFSVCLFVCCHVLLPVVPVRLFFCFFTILLILPLFEVFKVVARRGRRALEMHPPGCSFANKAGGGGGEGGACGSFFKIDSRGEDDE